MPEVNSSLAQQKQQAWALYQSGQLSRAIEACQHICASSTEDATAWCLLAAIHGQLKNYVDAKNCAKQAIRISAENDGAYSLLGDALVALKEPEKAIAAYRHALEINSENTTVRCSLGNVLVFRQQLTEALDVTEKVLDYDPEHHQSNYLVAMLNRRLGHLDAAKMRLLRLLNKKLLPRDRILILNEMGKLMEQLGDHAESFHYYKAAQDVYSDKHSQSVKGGAIFDTLYRQRGAITANKPANWAKIKPQGHRSEPIFLVGFPRSGTTLLEQILASHSRIAVTDEANILNRVIDSMPTTLANGANYPYNLHQLKAEDIRILRSCYWEHANQFMRAKPGAQRLVDKLPLNIIHLPLINRLFPRAKIIFALRDPRDVCLSCYVTIFDSNPAMINLSDPGKIVRLYKAIMDLWKLYEEELTLDKITVRYEDMVANTEVVAQPLIRFLNLGWETGMLNFFSEENRRYVNTPSHEGITSPMYKSSIGRWKNYQAFLSPMLDSLYPCVRKFGYDEPLTDD